MTFPMAVGLLATHGFASTLAAAGFASAASMIQQVEGIQLLLATSIVAIVYARFLGMFAAGLKNDRVNGKLAPEQTAALRALRAYLKRGSDALEHPAKAEAFVPVAAGIDCNAACEEPGKAEER